MQGNDFTKEISLLVKDTMSQSQNTSGWTQVGGTARGGRGGSTGRGRGAGSARGRGGWQQQQAWQSARPSRDDMPTPGRATAAAPPPVPAAPPPPPVPVDPNSYAGRVAAAAAATAAKRKPREVSFGETPAAVTSREETHFSAATHHPTPFTDMASDDLFEKWSDYYYEQLRAMYKTFGLREFFPLDKEDVENGRDVAQSFAEFIYDVCPKGAGGRPLAMPTDYEIVRERLDDEDREEARQIIDALDLDLTPGEFVQLSAAEKYYFRNQAEGREPLEQPFIDDGEEDLGY